MPYAYWILNEYVKINTYWILHEYVKINISVILIRCGKTHKYKLPTNQNFKNL